MLKLMPILEHMGACDESKEWIREKNFDTFSKAWAVCPKVNWIDWLVATLADDGSYGAQQLFDAAYDCADEDIDLEVAYAFQRENVERWLVEYAHKHGCAVEADALHASKLSAERTQARRELDAARAELAVANTQRDAHLSQSVELAARVTELEALKAQATRNEAALKARASTLEAQLAALTPAVVEVGGFRVGDLVEVLTDKGRFARIADMSADGGRAWVTTMTCSVQTGVLRRKPVEVGDTVRVVGGNARFVGVRFAVTCVDDKGSVWGSEGAWNPANVVAVAT